MSEHEAATARAFDGQAAAFERAPIQTDPRLLDGLAGFADLPPGARVLDAGCGPGLVARALLERPRGCSVLGCDLSGEMIARAGARCAGAGGRARFVRAWCGEAAAGSPPAGGRMDGAISRLVLHHAPDPEASWLDQLSVLRPGAVLVLADHLADADP